MEGTRTVNEPVVPNRFRRFKNGDTNLADKLKSERPFCGKDEASREMVEQKLSINSCLLIAECGPSQSTI